MKGYYAIGTAAVSVFFFEILENNSTEIKMVSHE